MPTCSRQLQKAAIALAWSLWTELGVSGWQRDHSSHAIDPERLLIFTGPLGDADPRLRDESIDWCVTYGRYVSAARLRNLLAEEPAEARDAFGRMAATVNAHSGLRWPGATQAQPFQRTGRSAIRDFRGPSLVVLRLRALFGVGARAEVVRAFVAAPSARLSAADLAVEAGYTKRNIAEALEALRMAGLLDVHALRNRRLYGLADAAWPTTLPGRQPTLFPPWSSVFRILQRSLAGVRAAEPLTTRARGVTAADTLRDLQPDLQLIGARLPESTPDSDPWATLEGVSLELAQAWASGSFKGAA